MEKTGIYIYIYIYIYMIVRCLCSCKGYKYLEMILGEFSCMSSKLLHPCKIVVGLFVDPCCFSCKKKKLISLFESQIQLGFFA
jgi:hypothetical protein